MRGEVLRPSDAGYEPAARVYNGMIEKRPALIAHCLDVAESRPAPRSMPTCSGQSAVVAATSASSRRSFTSCTRSARSMAGRCSGRSNRRQTC